MTIVAEFHPPDALPRFEAWKAAHERELASIPADEVQIQTGRAPSKGTFVRVLVAEPHAAAFRQPSSSATSL